MLQPVAQMMVSTSWNIPDADLQGGMLVGKVKLKEMRFHAA
jgi:hypothetical protein